jgi:hypothetical protein
MTIEVKCAPWFPKKKNRANPPKQNLLHIGTIASIFDQRSRRPPLAKDLEASPPPVTTISLPSSSSSGLDQSPGGALPIPYIASNLDMVVASPYPASCAVGVLMPVVGYRAEAAQAQVLQA